MRVTQSILTRNMIGNMNQNRETMDRLQSAMSTGKEVNSSSDDPVRFARANRYRQMIAQNDQYKRNINDAMGWTNNYETLMGELHGFVVEAKEAAIQGADNTQSAGTREIIAERVEGLINQVLNVANSSYVGKAAFAGTLTNVDTAFEYDGNTVTYNGNDREMSRRIAESLDVTINITGNDVQGTGVFTELIALRDALTSNDRVAVAAQIATLENVEDEMLTLASKVGLAKNHLSLTEERLGTAETNIVSFLSHTEDADLADIIAKYSSEEIAYKAALEATAKAINLNVLDFI